MSQHDYIINNDTAANVRADINSALAAIATTNSGTTAPPTPSANMLWYDTANDLLKIRNEANSAWITMGTVDQANSVFNPNFLPATQTEAETGTNNVKGMTPLRVAQGITSQVGTANSTAVKAALNASGSAPIYTCRAWINFNGSTTTIRASGNVSSIARSGVGDYTINFTTAMQDANYSAVGTGGADSFAIGALAQQNVYILDRATTSVKVYTINDNGAAAQDCPQVSVAIFR